MLSILPHLSYKPWFAMAEFVDNSLQSYLTYKNQIERAEGKPVQLKVRIETSNLDGGQITIRDDAAGIHEADYPRAFRPAAVPPDRSGLSEFGIGMKSAACWFARRWTVRTKALGERIQRTVHFDIDRIVRDELEELEVEIAEASPGGHFTEIVLWDLLNAPKGKTLGKIKDHLSSIYRVFMRQGVLLLQFDNELLTNSDPPILCAPYYKTPTEAPLLWRKAIDMDLGLGLRAYGFAALRATASTSLAGFALFRRNRLIQGSADESYRPAKIFGAPNSFTYQRLFGELHLEGFEVSHTKDGFQWQEHEDVFLDLLREELNRPPLRLLEQAEEHRVRQKPEDLKTGADIASQRTAETIAREVPEVFSQQLDAPPDLSELSWSFPESQVASQRVIEVDLHGARWQIIVELSVDPAVGDWIELVEHLDVRAAPDGIRVHTVGVRLSLTHPFMERFAGSDPTKIEPLLRIGAGLMLAEVAARNGGVKQAGTIRRNINELLRKALSKP